MDLSLSLEKDLWTTLLILATKAGVFWWYCSQFPSTDCNGPLIQHGPRFAVEGCVVVPGKPWLKSPNNPTTVFKTRFAKPTPAFRWVLRSHDGHERIWVQGCRQAAPSLGLYWGGWDGFFSSKNARLVWLMLINVSCMILWYSICSWFWWVHVRI